MINILFDGNYLVHKCFSIWSMYYQDRKKTPEENDAGRASYEADKESLIRLKDARGVYVGIGEKKKAAEDAAKEEKKKKWRIWLCEKDGGAKAAYETSLSYYTNLYGGCIRCMLCFV